ncbi:Aldo-keto reductase [Marinobacterium lacunae]|uniref:Aldo-keto reductase n=1 Tax=Marinobacterium lacunae TaxID=1232683 RepID=A0A081G1Z3_9GAMM|nr:aldo/keto reductase [Marinobacterium lacunae]KEA64798.1 Aldo-keto reductase [Marinobacterium lacunae]
MKSRILGASGIEVSALGLGCMGMSEFYGATDDAQSLRTLERAAELGISLFDTADMYGRGHNEALVGRFLNTTEYPVKIATKFGIVRDAPEEAGRYTRAIDNSPEYIERACEASLKRLGVECIDLYYAHRIDPAFPIEETIEAMARLVQAGKVRALGLCEVSAATLRRAHAVHPVSALQSEYSLWTRDPEEEVLTTCRELGVSFVAYSPMGRGFLTGAISGTDDLSADDFRHLSPRFQGENLQANLHLLTAVRDLAAQKGCTPAQLALAWLLHQRAEIIPIPGTRRVQYLEENLGAVDVVLSDLELHTLDKVLPRGAAAGTRYPEAGMKLLNT